MGVTSRRNKKCYHLIDDFETSASLGSFCGLIRWGKNVNLSPSVFPALKNFEVLMIASGNYHTVIVTEQGIYGWGDAHAGQLGNHNKSNSIIQ